MGDLPSFCIWRFGKVTVFEWHKWNCFSVKAGHYETALNAVFDHFVVYPTRKKSPFLEEKPNSIRATSCTKFNWATVSNNTLVLYNHFFRPDEIYILCYVEYSNVLFTCRETTLHIERPKYLHCKKYFLKNFFCSKRQIMAHLANRG